MLLAIACLRHIQLCPGSDLPQLRAGVLQWHTSLASLLWKSLR
jgi:hypothetical protein